MDSKLQATLLKKKKKNQEVYVVPVEKDGVIKSPLAWHSLWYDEVVHNTYMESFTKQQFRLCKFRMCISSLADGGKEKDHFHSRKGLYFRAQTSLSLILPTQRSEATVKWPEESVLVD